MLKIVKNSALKVARSFGYEIVPLRDMKARDFALHLRQLFEELRIDCVLDVGANIGQYRNFLRDRVLYEGMIISFEPVSRHVEFLKEHSLGDASWHIEGYALGRERGTRPIQVMKSDQFSSFLEPDNSQIPAFATDNVASYTEHVELRTLDDVLPKLQQTLGFKCPYLKLDTQGFDVEVLRGAETVLPTIPALQTEASVIGIYKGMPDYIETIRYLNASGFDVTGFYPVARDDRLRLIEFDCVMVSRAWALREQ